jgi:hypothetical protein
MERFPRGTLPPAAFAAALDVEPNAKHAALRPAVVARWAEPPAATQHLVAALTPPVAREECDLSATCPTCMIAMQPEHAHYKCPRCGYRDSCCF